MLRPDRPTLAATTPAVPPATAGRAVTARSVALGLLATVVVCAFTPYNDFALDGTPFVGNNLPLGLVSMALAFAVCVNGPLSRYRPGLALSGGEMAVAFSMGLVACCIPSSGLLRYFAPTLVSPWWFSGSRTPVREMMESLRLPDWAFPAMPEADVLGRANDPVVVGFMQRWTGDGPPPYLAWATPVLAWGLFFAAAAGAMVCVAAIVRRQWAENERLPFPIAAIQLALVEAPPPGRWLNAALSSRPLWLAAAGVFAVRLWNGMAVYQPGGFPPVPLGFDFNRVFTEEPFSYLPLHGKVATVYPIIVGVTYFLSAPVAFSLWAFVALDLVRGMAAGTFGTTPGNPGAADEHLGAIAAYALVALWIGRRHWRLVAAQGFRGERPGEPVGVYLPYRGAFWGLIACVAAMVAWLAVAGCTVLGAAAIVGLLMVLFTVLARVVAETGLVYTQLRVSAFAPFTLLQQHGVARPTTGETFFYAGLLNVTVADFREPLPVYASHALRLTDKSGAVGEPASGLTAGAAPDAERRAVRRRGAAVVACLTLALLVGYFVGWGSTLWTEYRYDATLDAVPRVPINWWGADVGQMVWFNGPASAYHAGDAILTPHNPAAHIGGGFTFAAFLGLMRARFAWWPLHPVGYLMIPTVTAQRMWVSIAVGWLAKVLVVRFGGSRLYVAGRSVFLGLILGDCLAAGFWLTVGVGLHAMGLPFRAIGVLPD